LEIIPFAYLIKNKPMIHKILTQEHSDKNKIDENVFSKRAA
jgi:hypothetical protein